jgi:hypothetical protein
MTGWGSILSSGATPRWCSMTGSRRTPSIATEARSPPPWPHGGYFRFATSFIHAVHCAVDGRELNPVRLQYSVYSCDTAQMGTSGSIVAVRPGLGMEQVGCCITLDLYYDPQDVVSAWRTSSSLHDSCALGRASRSSRACVRACVRACARACVRARSDESMI